MISVVPHQRSIARLSRSAKRRKESQKRFGTCKKLKQTNRDLARVATILREKALQSQEG